MIGVNDGLLKLQYKNVFQCSRSASDTLASDTLASGVRSIPE